MECRTVSHSIVGAEELQIDTWTPSGLEFLVQLQLCEMRFKGSKREQHPKNTIIKASQNSLLGWLQASVSGPGSQKAVEKGESAARQ